MIGILGGATNMEAKEILNRFKNGEITLEEAEKKEKE